jgi:hypothetical protein
VNPLEPLIQIFQSTKSDALFNAEKMIWPPDLPSYIINFERKLHPYLFLNAGLWIAKTQFAKQILKECLGVSPETGYTNSEQVAYKYCYRNLYPHMAVDYSSAIFQGLNRVSNNEIEFT